MHSSDNTTSLLVELINYKLQHDNLLTMIFHTQDLESGSTVIGRGLMVARATEKNVHGKWAPAVDGSKTLEFSQKTSSFEDVSDIHELFSKFS